MYVVSSKGIRWHVTQWLNRKEIKQVVNILTSPLSVYFFVYQGSFTCGACHPGFIGDGYTGCYPGDLCTNGSHTCHENAQCTQTGAGRFKCTVRYHGSLASTHLHRKIQTDFYWNHLQGMTFCNKLFAMIPNKFSQCEALDYSPSLTLLASYWLPGLWTFIIIGFPVEHWFVLFSCGVGPMISVVINGNSTYIDDSYSTLSVLSSMFMASSLLGGFLPVISYYTVKPNYSWVSYDVGMFLYVLEFPAYVVQSVTCMFCLFGLHMLSSSLTLLRNEVCFSLQCKAGYGGDGEECEVDPDLDGIPSIGLSCTLPNCYKVFQ